MFQRKKKEYTVCDMYRILTSDVPRLEVANSNSFWHANFPLKVSTKDNLCHIGVINADSPTLCYGMWKLGNNNSFVFKLQFFWGHFGIR